MSLNKIIAEDLLFSGEIEDDRTNTYLNLYDYDWMDYRLKTKFKTKEYGILNVEFSYFGLTTSTMSVEQTKDGVVTNYKYEYPSEVFKKYIMMFLEKHIKSWNSDIAFNGEDIVVEFYNEIVSGVQDVRSSDYENNHSKNQFEGIADEEISCDAD